MIIRITLILASIVYLAMYPKKSTWSIEKCLVTGIAFHFDWQNFLTFTLYTNTKIIVFNPNLVGSRIERANCELFIVFSKYDIRRIGSAKLIPSEIRRRGFGVIESVGEIDNIKLPFSLEILFEILKNNGRLRVMALGNAQVKPRNPDILKGSILPDFLVGMKCIEDLQLMLSLNIARLVNGVSNKKNCVYTYEWLPNEVKYSEELPFLDRKFIFHALNNVQVLHAYALKQIKITSNKILNNNRSLEI